METAFPGIARLSPQEGIERLKCPVFVFHAEDDRNISIEITPAIRRTAQANQLRCYLSFGADWRSLPIDDQERHSAGHPVAEIFPCRGESGADVAGCRQVLDGAEPITPGTYPARAASNGMARKR